MSLGLAFTVLATAVTSIQAVTYTTSVPRPGLFILHLHDRVPASVSLQREAGGLVLSFPGPVVGEKPFATGPIEDFSIEEDGGRVAIRLTLQARATVEIERAGEGLIVEVEQVATPTSSDYPRMADLYPLLFPAGIEPAQQPGPALVALDAPRQGLWLGPLNVRPAINVRYVNSDSVFVDDPTPTRVRYLEVAPVIDGSAGTGSDGSLTFRYAPRFRTGSSLDVVNSTTHILDAGGGYSTSPGTGLRGGYHFVTGTLETREVDPGGEFFFGLQPFTRHAVDGSADVALGAVWGLGVGADWNWVDIEEGSGFYSHERGSANANLWYDMSPTLRFRAGYRYDPCRDVFGDRAFIQRCQEHKKRNVADHLPESMRPGVRRAMNQAYECRDAKRAKRQLEALAARLESEHPGAAASLREGLDETLTVIELNLPERLQLSLRTTNPIDNLIGSVRKVSRRVKRWRGGRMMLRWCGAAVLDAEQRFRRIRGYREMPKLIAALRARDAELDEKENAA